MAGQGLGSVEAELCFKIISYRVSQVVGAQVNPYRETPTITAVESADSLGPLMKQNSLLNITREI